MGGNEAQTARDPVRAHAPGRVELLGNHTDYNGGYVLSAAIDRGVSVRGSRLDRPVARLRSVGMGAEVEVPLAGIARQAEHPWANYALGVVWAMREAGFAVGGFEMEDASDVPPGAGLSSSAAVEVATAVFLRELFGFDLGPMALAKLCRRAENEFVGVNCGLLDQVSSVFGRRGHAIFLDCREETVRPVPLPGDVELLIAHSGVKHTLTGGEYNERRARCFEAAAALGVRELRDADRAALEAARARLPEEAYRRALHVVGENARVIEGVERLRRGDVEGFGELMFASHESSRVNFENSVAELDVLVEIARGLDGVLGSRLTGGGFGGATVSLVRRAAVDEVRARLTDAYRARTGIECKAWVCEAADGARAL